MKNKYTYNIYFNNDANDLEITMESILIDYIKRILNDDHVESKIRI